MIVYTTTTGIPTIIEKDSQHLTNIARMHEAAQYLTSGEIAALDEAELNRIHCQALTYGGAEICDGTVVDGICVSAYSHDKV